MTPFTPYWALWRCPYGSSTWMLPVRVIGPPVQGTVDTVPEHSGILVRVLLKDLVGMDGVN